MAKITLNTDDLSGETIADDIPTTRLILDDPRKPIAVALDLGDESLTKLYDALQRYARKGRAITPPAPRKSPTASHKAGTTSTPSESALARAWALAQRPDLPVKDHGRVSEEVLTAYREHIAATEGHASEAAINAAMEAGMRAVEAESKSK